MDGETVRSVLLALWAIGIQALAVWHQVDPINPFKVLLLGNAASVAFFAVVLDRPSIMVGAWAAVLLLLLGGCASQQEQPLYPPSKPAEPARSSAEQSPIERIISRTAAQATGMGTGSWTGESGTAWSGKLAPASSITPAEIGELRARVCVGLASATVYVDPQIRIS